MIDNGEKESLGQEMFVSVHVLQQESVRLAFQLDHPIAKGKNTIFLGGGDSVCARWKEILFL